MDNKCFLKMLHSQEITEKVFKFTEGYKRFLDTAKTETLAIARALAKAQACGYHCLTSYEKLKPGDKVYVLNQNKNLCLVHLGLDDISTGVSMICAHVDSPRLDLKPQPLYEDTGLALLKTQYYGGIKKYQWGSRALALHGIVYLESGKCVEISLGEKTDEPVFTIPDLLPHLDQKVQRDRKAHEVLKGEELRVIIGSIPIQSENKSAELSSGENWPKNSVKKAVLKKLYDDYGICEEDFLSADLQFVPAGTAQDVGIDRGLVGGYGQDDRVCAYAALEALLSQKSTPQKSAMVFLVDKEEIGSDGITGAKSNFWRLVLSQILNKTTSLNKEIKQNMDPLEIFWKSVCLSGDVTAAVDPIFKEVHDEQNGAHLHRGLAITKYTGSRGKSQASEADAALVAHLRKILRKNNVPFQVGQLGKVDEGGGGTVASFFANHGVRTIDCGIAILGMHSPFEVVSKFDIYSMFQGYQAFLNEGFTII